MAAASNWVVTLKCNICNKEFKDHVEYPTSSLGLCEACEFDIHFLIVGDWHKGYKFEDIPNKIVKEIRIKRKLEKL